MIQQQWYPWVHVTWIHDYDSRFDAVFVHDVDGALIDYGYSRFHAGTSWNEDRWYEYTPTSMEKLTLMIYQHMSV